MLTYILEHKNGFNGIVNIERGMDDQCIVTSIEDNITSQGKTIKEAIENLNTCYTENIKKKKNNVIKFIYDCFFHDYFSIKIEWNEDNQCGEYVLYTTPRHGSFEKDDVKHYKKQIGEKHIKELLLMMDKYKYFDESNYIERLGLDGSFWTTEIKINNKYKKLTIWSPNDGIVYLIGKYLIDLSEIDLGKIY